MPSGIFRGKTEEYKEPRSPSIEVEQMILARIQNVTVPNSLSLNNVNRIMPNRFEKCISTIKARRDNTGVIRIYTEQSVTEYFQLAPNESITTRVDLYHLFCYSSVASQVLEIWREEEKVPVEKVN